MGSTTIRLRLFFGARLGCQSYDWCLFAIKNAEMCETVTAETL